ncbi:NAD(P)-dependent oxidoreductase [Pseudomonas putida]|nr:NAD(P)-dependent oxidoreductase [Pseudomonas putida]
MNVEEMNMANVAVLGLGAMGSRMATSLLKAGHHVTVWNRTPQAALPLVGVGAVHAQNPHEAAQSADVVLSMVRDDEASKEVWLHPETGALGAMSKNAVAVECSTVSHDWIKALGECTGEAGIPLIDAPVSGSRPQAESGQLVFLVGGDQNAVAAAKDVLLAMGSAVNHVGPLGSGTLVKLATNALLGVQVATLAELMGILASHQVDLSKAFEAIGSTTVSSAAAQRSASLMIASDFTPQFTVELINKDFGYAIKAAGGSKSAPTIVAAGTVFNTAESRGLGDLNMTGVAKLFPVSTDPI